MADSYNNKENTIRNASAKKPTQTNPMTKANFISPRDPHEYSPAPSLTNSQVIETNSVYNNPFLPKDKESIISNFDKSSFGGNNVPSEFKDYYASSFAASIGYEEAETPLESLQNAHITKINFGNVPRKNEGITKIAFDSARSHNIETQSSVVFENQSLYEPHDKGMRVIRTEESFAASRGLSVRDFAQSEMNQRRLNTEEQEENVKDFRDLSLKESKGVDQEIIPAERFGQSGLSNLSGSAGNWNIKGASREERVYVSPVVERYSGYEVSGSQEKNDGERLLARLVESRGASETREHYGNRSGFGERSETKSQQENGNKKEIRENSLSKKESILVSAWNQRDGNISAERKIDFGSVGTEKRENELGFNESMKSENRDSYKTYGQELDLKQLSHGSNNAFTGSGVEHKENLSHKQPENIWENSLYKSGKQSNNISQNEQNIQKESPIMSANQAILQLDNSKSEMQNGNIRIEEPELKKHNSAPVDLVTKSYTVGAAFNINNQEKISLRRSLGDLENFHAKFEIESKNTKLSIEDLEDVPPSVATKLSGELKHGGANDAKKNPLQMEGSKPSSSGDIPIEVNNMEVLTKVVEHNFSFTASKPKDEFKDSRKIFFRQVPTLDTSKSNEKETVERRTSLENAPQVTKVDKVEKDEESVNSCPQRLIKGLDAKNRNVQIVLEDISSQASPNPFIYNKPQPEIFPQSQPQNPLVHTQVQKQNIVEKQGNVKNQYAPSPIESRRKIVFRQVENRCEHPRENINNAEVQNQHVFINDFGAYQQAHPNEYQMNMSGFNMQDQIGEDFNLRRKLGRFPRGMPDIAETEEDHEASLLAHTETNRERGSVDMLKEPETIFDRLLRSDEKQRSSKKMAREPIYLEQNNDPIKEENLGNIKEENKDFVLRENESRVSLEDDLVENKEREVLENEENIRKIEEKVNMEKSQTLNENRNDKSFLSETSSEAQLTEGIEEKSAEEGLGGSRGDIRIYLQEGGKGGFLNEADFPSTRNTLDVKIDSRTDLEKDQTLSKIVNEKVMRNNENNLSMEKIEEKQKSEGERRNSEAELKREIVTSSTKSLDNRKENNEIRSFIQLKPVNEEKHSKMNINRQKVEKEPKDEGNLSSISSNIKDLLVRKEEAKVQAQENSREKVSVFSNMLEALRNKIKHSENAPDFDLDEMKEYDKIEQSIEKKIPLQENNLNVLATKVPEPANTQTFLNESNKIQKNTQEVPQKSFISQETGNLSSTRKTTPKEVNQKEINITDLQEKVLEMKSNLHNTQRPNSNTQSKSSLSWNKASQESLETYNINLQEVDSSSQEKNKLETFKKLEDMLTKSKPNIEQENQAQSFLETKEKISQARLKIKERRSEGQGKKNQILIKNPSSLQKGKENKPIEEKVTKLNQTKEPKVEKESILSKLENLLEQYENKSGGNKRFTEINKALDKVTSPAVTAATTASTSSLGRPTELSRKTVLSTEAENQKMPCISLFKREERKPFQVFPRNSERMDSQDSGAIQITEDLEAKEPRSEMMDTFKGRLNGKMSFIPQNAVEENKYSSMTEFTFISRREDSVESIDSGTFRKTFLSPVNKLVGKQTTERSTKPAQSTQGKLKLISLTDVFQKVEELREKDKKTVSRKISNADREDSIMSK